MKRSRNWHRRSRLRRWRPTRRCDTGSSSARSHCTPRSVRCRKRGPGPRASTHRRWDPSGLHTAEFYLTQSSLYAQGGDVPRWRESLSRAIEILERADTGRFLLRFAHGSIAVQALNLGEMDAARSHAAAGLALAKALRSDVAYMQARIAEIDLRAGRLSAARDALREIAASPGLDFLTRHVIAFVRARVAEHTGDDDEALRGALDLALLDEVEAGGNRFAVVTLATALAPTLAAQGRHDEASGLLARAAGSIQAPFGLVLEIATICRWAPEQLDRLRPLVARSATEAPGRVIAALSALVDAAFAVREGDNVAARTRGLEAASRFSEVGWPLLEAQARELAGETAQAIALYRRAGATGELRRLERRAMAEPTGGAVQGILTARERDVARLVAAGNDNAATAEALNVTRKTVEKYLTSIYEKLGITSRAKLAVYMLSGAPEDRGAGIRPKR
jgi:DNA-binding NarL/FixJ family response regulator